MFLNVSAVNLNTIKYSKIAKSFAVNKGFARGLFKCRGSQFKKHCFGAIRDYEIIENSSSYNNGSIRKAETDNLKQYDY